MKDAYKSKGAILFYLGAMAFTYLSVLRLDMLAK